MPEIHFTKGQGTGNDFVLIADPDGRLDLDAEQLAAIADRRFGVGGDGVIRAVRSENLPEGAAALAEDPAATWFMDYHNADGSPSEMCGNGIRVFAEFLSANGFIDLGRTDTLTVGTRAGVRDLQRNQRGFQVDLGRWQLDGGDPLVRAQGVAVARPGLGINVGNPHVVVALSSLDELAAADLTQAPVLEPAAAEGANVEFVVPHDPLVKDGVGHITMRVHERGSGETLSCGTGAAAAALATRHWAGSGAPDQWKVAVPGGTLGVRMWPAEDGEHVSLSGPAVLVYEGDLSV